jgi:hypothetical protein
MITTSIIVSDFTGFSGKSIFVLLNGQVWQQDVYKYQYFCAYRPKATIKHNGSRGILTVNGNECSVKKIR